MDQQQRYPVTYTAIVHRKTLSVTPVIDTAGKPVLDPVTGKQKEERFEFEATDNPLVDDGGNPVEAGTREALLRRVREQFEGDPTVEVQRVWVRETQTVAEVTGDDLKKV